MMTNSNQTAALKQTKQNLACGDKAGHVLIEGETEQQVADFFNGVFGANRKKANLKRQAEQVI